MKKILIALIMAISVTTPIQTMAESVAQSDVEMQPSEQNIEQIIDEITSEPHPINSDAIQNVKEYIIQYWGDLAREIVTRQGGYIKVVSEPGKGSEFSIMLPTK